MDGICTESLTVVVRIFIFIILTRISGRGVICKGDGNKSQINNEIFMKHHFSVLKWEKLSSRLSIFGIQPTYI